MFRHGVAVAALVLALASALVAFPVRTLSSSALAGTAAERWGAAVFVRRAGASAPLAVQVADTRSKTGSDNSQDEVPPLPEHKPDAATPGKTALPVAPTPKPEPDVWPPKAIADAKARCAKQLKGLDAVVIPQEPVREGRCGTPAPIKLVSLGSKKSKVTFSPPAYINCDMVVALDTWIRKDVQPLALKHLGTPISKIEVMSDYSCRNVAGIKRLSEHALANALDIRGFITSKGQKARVLGGWGKTKREIAADLAAAKAKAKEKALAVENASMPLQETAVALQATKAKAADHLRKSADKLNGPPPPPTPKKDAKKYAALSPPASADPEANVAPQKPKLDNNARFLRAAHDAACRIFGTTLGPEANKAHMNHFHVDMAERKWKKICD